MTSATATRSSCRSCSAPRLPRSRIVSGESSTTPSTSTSGTCPSGTGKGSAGSPPISDAGHVRDFDLEPVGILEKHRVVARPVLGILPGRIVECRDSTWPHELRDEAIHVATLAHTEADVIDARILSMEAGGTAVRWRRDHPEVRRPVRDPEEVVGLDDDPVVEKCEQLAIERDRLRIADIDLDVVEERLHAAALAAVGWAGARQLSRRRPAPLRGRSSRAQRAPPAARSCWPR